MGMKFTIVYLRKIACNLKTLTELKFFKLLVSITIVLILTVLVCIYAGAFNITDLTNVQLEYFLESNHFIIMLDGGIFTLTLNINNKCDDPKDAGSYLTRKLIDLLRLRNVEIKELSTVESEVLRLITKYGGDLCEQTINNIIKQNNLIRGE